MDDSSLAHALLSRDSRAPKEAWVRFRPIVRAIVARRLGPDAEVEDLTQEIFYRVFARIGTLRNPNALRSFVASFAFRAVKWERRRRRARRHFELTSDGVIPDHAVDDSLRYAFWDAFRVCDKLRRRKRDVILLRHVHGMTLEETAEALGLSVATVKRALLAARQAIRHRRT
jgi:RNA polymerase sigma-70 factor (ECF subfamily)